MIPYITCTEIKPYGVQCLKIFRFCCKDRFFGWGNRWGQFFRHSFKFFRILRRYFMIYEHLKVIFRLKKAYFDLYKSNRKGQNRPFLGLKMALKYSKIMKYICRMRENLRECRKNCLQRFPRPKNRSLRQNRNIFKRDVSKSVK